MEMILALLLSLFIAAFILLLILLFIKIDNVLLKKELGGYIEADGPYLQKNQRIDGTFDVKWTFCVKNYVAGTVLVFPFEYTTQNKKTIRLSPLLMRSALLKIRQEQRGKSSDIYELIGAWFRFSHLLDANTVDKVLGEKVQKNFNLDCITDKQMDVGIFLSRLN